MWKEIFEFVFRIEPTSGNIFIDLFLPAALSMVFYEVSFRIVNKMYRSHIIESRSSGKFFHWLIRSVIVYASVYMFNVYHESFGLLIILAFLCVIWYFIKKL